MYPPLQCHAQGWLHAGDGHQVYWEACGNPMGVPALFVHGGPGAGCGPDDRRWFDPRHYRILLLDQRGAGRSRPQGGLRANTTAHLMGDMELLRGHLSIERWLLFGGSWGTTLSLAYAQRHPERVAALVLRGVFLATQAQRCWLYSGQGAALAHPQAWDRLTAGIPESHKGDPLDTLAARLHCGEAAVEQAAAQAWLRWEQDLMDLEASPAAPGAPQPAPAPTPEGASAVHAARLGVHYARAGFFLEEGQLLRDAGRLRDVPGIIVQGQRDLVTPPAAAQALHRAWPGSRLVQVDAAGHSSRHPSMARQLIAATDEFRDPRAAPAAGPRTAPTTMETSDERRQPES
jgi:proline iminopeptidase